MNYISAILNPQDELLAKENVSVLESSPLVSKVFISPTSLSNTSALKSFVFDSEYILIYTKPTLLRLGQFSLERMYHIARSTQAAMVYADHFTQKEDQLLAHPLNDYQQGSLRDDFDFGSLFLIPQTLFRKAVQEMTGEYLGAGLYDLRLRLSRMGELVHINEYLYTEIETDLRKSGEKQFDYVDPKNRAIQIEMENACTDHMKEIGAWLAPDFNKVEFNRGDFSVEASVIIPVRNRSRTIADAISSVLKQETSFEFNLIIVDNHSSDGTTEIIREFAAGDKRIIHVIPQRNDLGIGGCWNEGIFSESCGKFAIQLDSDDVYSDEHTLSKIVSAFYKQNCAMVVGSYTMTNFNMETIPPGLIDHKEWTPENGRNNALRINGLGAPRAFYTPVLREIRVPNTSYGEDYALGLAISRNFQIGRIYDSLYLCRRWEDNSDASLDIVKMNAHNSYKDKLRSIELKARILKNSGLLS